MAQKPLRPCRHPGCCVLVPGGYCAAHKPKDSARRSEESKSWHWMYLTPEWLNDLRPGQLLREPFCRECAQRGIRTRATDVDHVEPHNGDWSKFTDRAICKAFVTPATAARLWRKAGQNVRRFAGGTGPDCPQLWAHAYVAARVRMRGGGSLQTPPPRSKKFQRICVRPHAPLHARFFPHGEFGEGRGPNWT